MCGLMRIVSELLMVLEGKVLLICHLVMLQMETRKIQVLRRESQAAHHWLDEGGFGQLMSIIGTLAADVSKLTATVAELHSKVNRENAPQVSSAEPGQSYAPLVNNMVLTEVREIHEREKRKFSVILRGVNCESTQEVLSLFQKISSYLNVGSICIEDLVKVAPMV